MSKPFDQGREEIAKLCKYFADNRRDFFAPGVKEAHVRQSLIDPLFEALGERGSELIQRQIESSDHEIDRLVYELYGLTEEEINIVKKSEVH